MVFLFGCAEMQQVMNQFPRRTALLNISGGLKEALNGISKQVTKLSYGFTRMKQ
jgi:hypothetical protein